MIKTVNIQVKWAAVRCGGPALDQGRRPSSKTAPGLLPTGSPVGRCFPHGDGSTYSQAHVRAVESCGSVAQAQPSMIVDSETVLREVDGLCDDSGVAELGDNGFVPNVGIGIVP